MYTRPTFLLPNRLATILILVVGAVGAALPVAANMDWESTAGILAGVGAIAAALVTWLRGWQANEQDNLTDYKRQPADSATITPPPAAAAAPPAQTNGAATKFVPVPTTTASSTDGRDQQLALLKAELDRVGAKLDDVRRQTATLSTEIADISRAV